jgi:voltage-gated potassium channel
MATQEGGAERTPPSHPRAFKFLVGKALTAGRAARIIISVTLVVTVVSGVAMHYTDKKSFPNVGDGVWWAVQTVTTVGYGDLVPKSVAGRIVATIVMLVGIGFLTVVTALITSTFIEAARRRFEGNTSQTLARKVDEIGLRLEAIAADLTEIRRNGEETSPGSPQR